MSTTTPAPDVSAAALAAALGIPERTARRYKARGLPFPWAVVWRVLGCGDLGAVCPAFAGWRIHRGQIYSPDGYGFTPGELAAIPLRYQQLRELELNAAEPRQLLLT